MTAKSRARGLARARQSAILAVGMLAACFTAQAADSPEFARYFWPGNLVISRSVYNNDPNNVQVGTVLPPNCANTTGGCGAASGAPNDGAYPSVWNNDIYDASFGITSKIVLDQVTVLGWLVNSLPVPNSSESGIKASSDQMVTSFSSKSELGLHLSLDNRYLTFMGYVAPVGAVDISNSNTAGAVDPTNPVGQNFYRAVAQVGANGKFTFTETNAYSGNNGRSAILNSSAGVYYTAGNAGNGSNPQPEGIVLGAGAQIIGKAGEPENKQTVATPAPVASFSVTQLGAKADKIGKDDNFRGMTVYKNVLYYTKGSGSNGVNTVYFVDTTGTACPNGVGLPSSSATLPTTPLSYDPGTLATNGLPNNMCILAGFPSMPNSTATTTAFLFGLWFANATTLYLADEGDGYVGGSDLYTHAASQSTAGLQKWVFDSSAQSWKRVYTLQTGLQLGIPYTVSGYPTGTNVATKLPWSPATDGLRNITGLTIGDAAVIWAVTSTISGNGDTGADPNKVVVVIDSLTNTDQGVASTERFYPFRQAGYAEVLRGISFAPGTEFGQN